MYPVKDQIEYQSIGESNKIKVNLMKNEHDDFLTFILNNIHFNFFGFKYFDT